MYLSQRARLQFFFVILSQIEKPNPILDIAATRITEGCFLFSEKSKGVKLNGKATKQINLWFSRQQVRVSSHLWCLFFMSFLSLLFPLCVSLSVFYTSARMQCTYNNVPNPFRALTKVDSRITSGRSNYRIFIWTRLMQSVKPDSFCKANEDQGTR